MQKTESFERSRDPFLNDRENSQSFLISLVGSSDI
jgi:hypothetical protein